MRASLPAGSVVELGHQVREIVPESPSEPSQGDDAASQFQRALVPIGSLFVADT